MGERRRVMLETYACQGGSAHGYVLAGWNVVCVDNTSQPRNPYTVIVADAVEFIREHGWKFDAIHASCPCQHDSDCQRIMGREHPDLIVPTRDAILKTGLPYVIENVKGAVPKLRDPVMVCGTMFGLEMYRHRYFETNWPLTVPRHSEHVAPQVKMGRAPKPGEFIQAVGNFSGVQRARDVMGMPWANRDGLREAIPPAYTQYIGKQLLEYLHA